MSNSSHNTDDEIDSEPTPSLSTIYQQNVSLP
jgi:hypothetical protein